MYIPWDDLESSVASTTLLTSELVAAASLRLKDFVYQWGRNYKEELRAFHPKVRIFVEKDAYAIKTAESSWELEAALRLRHDVFYQEMQQRRSRAGFDIDEFDLCCDHLIIVEKNSERVVGTYRVNASAYSQSFYSDKEFHLEEFLRTPGSKMELGRACIHKQYRTGMILALLWKGIVQYAERVSAEVMFGCSSIQTVDPYEALKISAYLEKNGYVVPDLPMPPRLGFRFLNWDEFRVRYEPKDPETLAGARKQISPLLLSYLRIGARVGVQPALDRSFGCVDFMTVLETRMIAAAYEKKFSRC